MPSEDPTAQTLAPAPTKWMREGKSFGISAENLDTALASYTEEQRETLSFWFHLAKEKAWSLKELERQTGVSSSSLTRVFRGIYGADAGTIIARLAKARENLSHAAENPEFLMTSLARTMWMIFDKARSMRNVSILWGIKGIGKSAIMREYARLHNHGHTYYVRCPGHGCTIYQFVRHVADAMHISPGQGALQELRTSIIAYLSRGNRLLLIDELHEIFLTCRPRTVVQICEFLRELADVAECGLCLVGTEALHYQFFRGVHKEVLGQLVDRGTVQVNLRDKPTKQDVVMFLQHYGLVYPGEHEADAAAMLNDMLRAAGLRKLTFHLRDGAAYAARRGESYQWSHFIAAHDAIAALNKPSR